ncbi:MAG: aspartyl/asparaginyl beta-hydroxylase domain-containing protein [Gammaproteobacteria bacterium]
MCAFAAVGRYGTAGRRDRCPGTVGLGYHRWSRRRAPGAEALFLRGYAPAEGPLPINDRPVLAHLPYVREVLEMLGASAQRCLLARLPAGQSIAPHIDRAPYFAKTLRIHVPVVTNDHVYMLCAGQGFRMRAGEVWGLNNSAPHGVWNADSNQSRTHLICDFLPTATLLDLITRGERSLGQHLPEVERHLANLSA